MYRGIDIREHASCGEEAGRILAGTVGLDIGDKEAVPSVVIAESCRQHGGDVVDG